MTGRSAMAPLRSRSGRLLTGEVIEEAAERMERGYEPDELRPRKAPRPPDAVSNIAFGRASAHTGCVTPPNLNSLAIPDDEMTASAAEAAAKLASYLREHPTPSGRVVLCVQDAPDTTVTVPAEAFRLFIDLLDRLSQGSAVTIAPVDAQLTTQQAAELLNVSRPHLVKLLEQGEIPFRKVGTHRRVLLRDVLDYQRRDDARRIEVLRELTRESEDLGLYDD